MKQEIENFNYKCGKEEWYDVPSFNGVIQISNYERIRSWKRGMRKEPPKNAKQIATYIGNTGYIVCTVRDEKQVCRTLKPHRIFALIFLPNPNSLPEVNHIDGDKLNNNPKTNLEWCDKLHNMRHAFKKGLIVPCRGENKPQSKITNTQALEIFNSTDGALSLAKRYGVNRSAIWNIRTGKTWSSITGVKSTYKSVIP